MLLGAKETAVSKRKRPPLYGADVRTIFPSSDVPSLAWDLPWLQDRFLCPSLEWGTVSNTLWGSPFFNNAGLLWPWTLLYLLLIPGQFSHAGGYHLIFMKESKCTPYLSKCQHHFQSIHTTLAYAVFWAQVKNIRTALSPKDKRSFSSTTYLRSLYDVCQALF